MKAMASMKTLARLSLAFLWIFTALTSAIFDRPSGEQILALANISGSFSDLLINLGSLVDLVIGIWLLTGRQLKLACWLQIIVILGYSTLLTIIAPIYWLHPFGPITKNIPLLVLIYWLIQIELNATPKSPN